MRDRLWHWLRRDLWATITSYAKLLNVNNASETESEPALARVAIAIPCFNEAPAIASVVADLRTSLPNADIFVFDNNSTDDTGAIAAALGIPVVPVPRQGKGHAVRAAFSALSDFDILILTDGDGTYPADAAPFLIAPVIAGTADMAVGARRPVAGAGAMTLTRWIGNVLIRLAFRLSIGPGTTDLLSGYRAFNKRFRETVQLRSPGFEIETELGQRGGGAEPSRRRDSRRLSSPNRRHAKQAARLRDGWRILLKIVTQGLRLRPHRLLLAWLLPCGVLAAAVDQRFAVAGALGLIGFWSLVLFDIRARMRSAVRQTTMA